MYWDHLDIEHLYILLSLDLTLDQTESKRYPKCSRSHILHNHTLKGGLRAGNFSVISQVDSIENCAAICCNEENCDLALMLDEVCYIGDCANTDLCVPVPVFEGSRRTSQIAFISNPRKASDNDLIKGKHHHPTWQPFGLAWGLGGRLRVGFSPFLFLFTQTIAWSIYWLVLLLWW